MWEYNRITIEFGLVKDLLAELNTLGADGWEIIYYEETKPEKFGKKFKSVVLFKRRKPCTQDKQ